MEWLRTWLSNFKSVEYSTGRCKCRTLAIMERWPFRANLQSSKNAYGGSILFNPSAGDMGVLNHELFEVAEYQAVRRRSGEMADRGRQAFNHNVHYADKGDKEGPKE